MPSFLDLLQSPDDDGHDAPLDVLASVKAEGGRRRRRRHRRNAALSGLALVLVAVPALALVGGSGDGEDVRSTDLAGADEGRESGAPASGRATTSTTAPVTEVAGVVVTQVPEQATPTTQPPRPTAPPTTEPPLVCENSVDPACGPFSWSPAPGGNAPLVLSPPEGEVHVAAGSGIVEIVIAWSDADASLEWQYVDPEGTLLSSGCSQPQRFGPWTSPAPNPGSGTFAYSFDTSGYASGQVVTLGVSAASGTLGGDCDDPYRSESNLFLDVHID